MRQAAQTMMAGLFLTLCPLAQDRVTAADAAGTLAQAGAGRRQELCPGGDPPGRLLVEADASDRRPILDLLLRSYDAMAREAKAAGKDREGASPG